MQLAISERFSGTISTCTRIIIKLLQWYLCLHTNFNIFTIGSIITKRIIIFLDPLGSSRVKWIISVSHYKTTYNYVTRFYIT